MSLRPRLLATAILALTASVTLASAAGAGHEFPFYPSYYPQEITVRAVAPAGAPARLADATMHAYVGADPFGAAAPPASVAQVTSLGAYVVVTLNPAAALGDPARRCLAARAAAASLATAPGFRAHAYPVTAYHPDYLQHADLAARAVAASPVAWTGPLRLRVRDALAAQLVPAAHRADGADWDATVETVEASALWAGLATGPNGGAGPPWLKAGWHHAYLLLRDGVTDATERRRLDAEHAWLVGGEPAAAPARLTRERGLVTALRAGCERTVAGYTERREPLNVDYSSGVENVALDAQAGLNSAIFVRTVKLKDFPWNGWLTVGVPARATAAWNPLAGFTDPTGRLIWAGLADPALFPSPHGDGWVPNRVAVTETQLGAPDLAVPDDAVAPEPGTGVFRRVGPGRRAAARVLYRVLGSRFHDGTTLEVADLLYALGLPWRTRDPAVLAATARQREGLAALRVLRVETDVLAFGEDKLTYEVPIVEVFLEKPSGPTPEDAALVAPPWTAIPWPLLWLAEDAEARGVAALSREAAEARGLPWLDLARDRAVLARLRARLDDLVGSGQVPPALAGLVTPEGARARWTKLRAFQDGAGHLLVTNGPYRLASWTDDTTVLQVFRDLSYPRGVGVFNRHAIPLRAWVTAAEARPDGLVLRGDLERVDRFGREFKIVREPLVTREVRQDKRSLPVARYVAVGPDGAVAGAGTAEAEDPGQYRIDLRALDRPGAYTILVALTVDGDRTGLPVQVVPWTR